MRMLLDNIINHPTRTILRFCERMSKNVSEDALIAIFCAASIIAAFWV